MTEAQQDHPGPRGQEPRVVYGNARDLTIHQISDDELQQLIDGSSNAIFLNIALALLPTSIALILALAVNPVPEDRLLTLITYVAVAVVFLVVGVVLIIVWARTHKSVRQIADGIRSRVPRPAGIREDDSEPATGTPGEEQPPKGS